MKSLRIVKRDTPNFVMHVLAVLNGVAEIADGLVTILSLGFLTSNFEFFVIKCRAEAHIRGLKKEREKQQKDKD